MNKFIKNSIVIFIFFILLSSCVSKQIETSQTTDLSDQNNNEVYCGNQQTGLRNIAAVRCESLFNNASAPAERTTDSKKIESLQDLGENMANGMELNPHQQDIFEFYKDMFLGTGSKATHQTLKDVQKLIDENPGLTKPAFNEYNVSQVEKVYEPTPELTTFLKSQIQSAGQVKSNLYQPEANLGFWKKILNYSDKPISQNLPKEEQKKRQAQNKLIFEKYLNGIINKSNQKILESVDKSDFEYLQKAQVLFKTLEYMRNWMEKKGKDSQSIRQAMVDLVHTVGYSNASTMTSIKSKNALQQIEGFRKILDERDLLAMMLGYPGHFNELIKSLNIDFPTGLSKNENPADKIKILEQQNLLGSYTTKEGETYRVRQLTMEESPFRSCLGGSDCSSVYYFSKALDPNYNYFTMTDSNHFSSGHVTVVLGEATDANIQKPVKVGFIDKLQNVPIQQIEYFLTAVAKSLAEKGYLLVTPDNVGDHNGLSNMDNIRSFVDQGINPRLKITLSQFQPHKHKFQFENLYSRAYDKLNVRIYEPKNMNSDVQITAGRKNIRFKAPFDLSKESLVQSFLKLKDSDNKEDILKFINSSNTVKKLSDLSLYSKEQYIKDLEHILESNNDSKIQKEAIFNLAYLEKDIITLLNWLSHQPQDIIQQYFGEISSFGSSNKELNKFIYTEFNIFSLIKHPSLQKHMKSFFEKQQDQKSTLFQAIKKERTDVIEWIMEHDKINKKFLNETNIYGDSFLHAIAKNIKDEIFLNRLFGIISDFNIKNQNQETSLLSAIMAKNSQYIQILLKYNIKNSFKKVDLNAYEHNNKMTTAAILLDSKLNWSDDFDIVKTVLSTPGLNINIIGSRNETILTKLIREGNKYEISKLLENKTLDLNQGESALAIAIRMGRFEYIDAILNHPSFSNKSMGNSALLALEKRDYVLLEKLFRTGKMDVNAPLKDAYGGVKYILKDNGFKRNTKYKYLYTEMLMKSGS